MTREHALDEAVRRVYAGRLKGGLWGFYKIYSTGMAFAALPCETRLMTPAMRAVRAEFQKLMRSEK